ncbi:hypothetical protein NDU88_004001 [Pleurodeles waltl]|uniref:Uncharacterized protein n=1 Tax=Pleurodeles waltl TaxID=8319 RepID=A0AAV7KWG6_PLEWA|nr:hypothetical protein NDU88_004001 [Pleurodeles waltl]
MGKKSGTRRDEDLRRPLRAVGALPGCLDSTAGRSGRSVRKTPPGAPRGHGRPGYTPCPDGGTWAAGTDRVVEAGVGVVALWPPRSQPPVPGHGPQADGGALGGGDSGPV